VTRPIVLVIALLGWPGLAATAVAQREEPAGVSTPRGAAPAATDRGLWPSRLARPDSAWWVPLSSAIVPGSGQVRLGQSRFIAYLAVETWSVVGYLNAEAAARHERTRYLTLARDVARAFVLGNDRVGNWNYYESMEKHVESGVFDRTPGTGAFSPETDTATFNGAVWLRARQLSRWADPNVEPPRTSPEYSAAVAYYAQHAVTDAFRWTWRNAQLEWDAYRQSIRRRNDASREAGHYLGILAANHVLSAVDAFITIRLRGGLGATRRGLVISASVPIR